ncbi:MAG: response regulator [Myxococcales bacterium]|nr:response regulator [Myxococcales bacterium]
MKPAPTVLISDDEPHIVHALARLFRRAGLQTIGDTSQSVCELARHHQPDLIVLDVNQRIDGRDLLAALKRDPLTRHLKVLMLSAIEDQYTRLVCFQLGAEDYEVKPFDQSFVRKIARMAGVDSDRSASPYGRSEAIAAG